MIDAAPEFAWEPGNIIRDVLFGRKKHLFLAQGAHRSMDLANRIITIPERSFEIFRANIERRAELAAGVGARYVHVIFPDKQSVLRDEYPFDDIACVSDLYRDQCRVISPYVLYTTEVLRRNDNVYKRTDTHLTDLGNLLAATAITQRLGFEIPSEFTTPFLASSKDSVDTGDLGVRFNPPISSTENVLNRQMRLAWYHNDLHGGNNGIVDIRFSPDALFSQRVMFFGDSFGRDCVRFLSIFFRHTVFLRTPYCHDELVTLYHPDIVITENVERYLDNVLSDMARDLFLMIPYLSKLQYAPSVDFARAFSAEFNYGLDKYRTYLDAMNTRFAIM